MFHNVIMHNRTCKAIINYMWGLVNWKPPLLYLKGHYSGTKQSCTLLSIKVKQKFHTCILKLAFTYYTTYTVSTAFVVG